LTRQATGHRDGAAQGRALPRTMPGEGFPSSVDEAFTRDGHSVKRCQTVISTPARNHTPMPSAILNQNIIVLCSVM
jgi:hypothetical protein